MGTQIWNTTSNTTGGSDAELTRGGNNTSDSFQTGRRTGGGDDHYYPIAMTYKILPPLMYAMSTFGNVMTLVVLRSLKSWGSAFKAFLMALAVSDQTVQTTGLFFNWVGNFVGSSLREKHVALCKGPPYVTDVAGKLSSWFLVVLTFQRAASVVWPHRVRVWCTHRRALMVIVVLVLVSVLYHVHILITIDYIVLPSGKTMCFKTLSQRNNRAVDYCDLLLFALIPHACLLVSNTVMARALAASVSQARASLATSSTADHSQQHVHNRQAQASSTTVMVMLLSFTFMVFTLPICVLNIFIISDPSFFRTKHLSRIIVVAYFLVFSNNTFNFYLYCVTGTSFRRQFWDIVTCGGRRSNGTHFRHGNDNVIQHRGGSTAGVAVTPKD